MRTVRNVFQVLLGIILVRSRWQGLVESTSLRPGVPQHFSRQSQRGQLTGVCTGSFVGSWIG